MSDQTIGLIFLIGMAALGFVLTLWVLFSKDLQ